MLCKPFDKYIAECVNHIKQRRDDLHAYPINPESVIAVNSPFEMRPDTNGTKPRYGALLIHGLLDSPFSQREIAEQLKNAGILCRAILLPGHGTQPADLLHVKYEEWVEAVRYGVESMRNEVEEVFLIGYSTGGTLSIYHALNDSNIKGIILLAPALKIRAPVSTIVRWPLLSNFFSREDKWLSQDENIDYAKYESVPFNPVIQLDKLIQTIDQHTGRLNCPVLMIMSENDETVCATAALRFFKMRANENSQFILYQDNAIQQADKRITSRAASHPDWHIKNLSHIAVPYSPANSHYGQHGDYTEHSGINDPSTIYGAYNRIEVKIFDQLNKLRLVKKRRRTLSYNPDFNYMTESIIRFITPPTK